MRYLSAEHRVLRPFGRGRRLVILDFDGTLAPIAAHPALAKLPRPTRAALERLVRRRGTRVAFISGRRLVELKKKIGVRGAVYMGNHGLEMSGLKTRLPDRVRRAARSERDADLLYRRLSRWLKKRHGFYIEHKGPSVTVHTRAVRARRKERFRELMRRYVRWHGHSRFDVRKGKQAIEFRPVIRWDKGTSAVWLTRRFPRDRVLVIGDDRTDEDMFRELDGRGLTVRVGRSRRSHARFYLKSTGDVRRVLERLCRS